MPGTSGSEGERVAAQRFFIQNGWCIDPATGSDGPGHLLIENGYIVAQGAIDRPVDATIIDADGLIVAPGFIDVHVHLRTPGFEYKESIETGTAAAAAGGFSTVFCMPNTDPCLDDVAVIQWLNQQIAERASVRVRPIAAITKGRLGQEPVHFDDLASLGVVGFSDDGVSTMNSALMVQALDAASRWSIPVMVHCEDANLATGGMHLGETSAVLGLAGIPPEAEEIIIARDIMLARLTGGWLHVCHVSTGRGADLIRQAKTDGVRVTGEVMPHHLTMTDAWVAGYRTLENVSEPEVIAGPVADPNTKVNPPLRTASDTRQLLRALINGTIDLVSTDHAPHADHEKATGSFATAAMGLSGSEFALPLMLALVRAGHFSRSDLVHWLSTAPARLWKLPGGTLAPGSPADLVLFDPEERWTVTKESLKTRSANTPLLGMELQGRVVKTMVGGEMRHGG